MEWVAHCSGVGAEEAGLQHTALGSQSRVSHVHETRNKGETGVIQRGQARDCDVGLPGDCFCVAM